MLEIFDYKHMHAPWVMEPTQYHTHTVIILKGHLIPCGAFARYFCKLQASDGQTLPQMFPTFKWVFLDTQLWDDEDARYDDIWEAQMPEQRLELDIEGLDVYEARTRAERKKGHIGQSSGRVTLQPRLKLENDIVDTIVGTELSFVPASRIILGGHSQGCTTAIWSSLVGGSYHLGGFIGLSGWLHSQTAKEAMMRSPQDRKSIPIFLAHCEDDELVPIENVFNLSSVLENYGMHVEVGQYETGGHGWPWYYRPETVDDVAAFLRRVAGESDEAIMFDDSEWEQALLKNEPQLIISQLRKLAACLPLEREICERYCKTKRGLREMDVNGQRNSKEGSKEKHSPGKENLAWS